MGYFHRMVSSRRHVNFVTPSMVRLSVDSSVSDLKASVTNVFKSHFHSSKSIHVEI